MKLLASAGCSKEKKTSGLKGRIRVPGDKSISHRSIMFGSIAEGKTEVEGFLEGADALATLEAFRAMGVEITTPINGALTIQGVGLHGLQTPAQALNLGNSGTSMRLLAGLLAGQNFNSTLIGDESLSARPMGRVAKPLALMGASIETEDGGLPPLKITGGNGLKAIDYTLPMASAQVKSCVLLAGIYAEGETIVTEPEVTRDHTERMLNGFGYEVKKEGAKSRLVGGGKLLGTKIDIPADISSAAFFIVAASIVPDSELLLEHVGINPTRTGIIDILKLMGADISLLNEREVGGEPVADIMVRSAELNGIDIPPELVPLAIDEFPVLFIAAACAKGKTVLTNAEELRVKESDRIDAMIEGLQAMGLKAEGTTDGAIIEGGTLGKDINQVVINCYHDHRIAMSFAIASTVAYCDVLVNDCDNIVTSFPNFVDLCKKLNMNIDLD